MVVSDLCGLVIWSWKHTGDPPHRERKRKMATKRSNTRNFWAKLGLFAQKSITVQSLKRQHFSAFPSRHFSMLWFAHLLFPLFDTNLRPAFSH